MTSESIINNEKKDFDILKEFLKYLYYWKYFLLSLIIFFSTAFFYIKYTGKIYKTTAKIKILDKKDSALEMPSAATLFSSSKINLENEKELIISYPILSRVVKNLNLNVSVYAVGDIQTSLITKDSYPFFLKSKINSIDFTERSFNVKILENGLEVIDNKDGGKTYTFKGFNTTKTKHQLPFNIYNVSKEKKDIDSYLINFNSTETTVNKLKKNLQLNEVGRESDIIAINFNSTNYKYAKNIIDELVDVYNKDGIVDRQLVHKRTIDFVNSRYLYLAKELDSVEFGKQRFKQENKLIDLSLNSNLSLQQSSSTKEDIFKNENQIFITTSLIEELYIPNFELIPSNIGMLNEEINNLTDLYNKKILDYKKISKEAGPNNPVVLQLKEMINSFRSNIIFSLKTHLKTLNNFNDQKLTIFNKYNSQLIKAPENEKILRSINRNQETKEALYLFLLQKREEAEVSFAITEPSIKIVEYAIYDKNPLSPKPLFIYLGAFVLAISLPFSCIYLVFLFNTKIQTREDIIESQFKGNVLAEIPFFDLTDNAKVFSNPADRSIVSESFRMLMSNTRYLLSSDNKDSSVILVTSSIKGEGKTLTAINLSLSFASLDKKVLLIGCDLRNPQLHKYVDEEKDQKGVVNFLVDNKLKWKDWVLKKFEKLPNHDILLCGSLPPNPLNLINNGNLDALIEQAKKEYDYIIIDTAPTLLVADTKSIMKLSDACVYLTRCNVTDKEILNHINESANETNLGLVLNGVGEKNAYGYSYGYKYGYGYKYKYSYNYGYGYGYNEDKD